VFAMDTVIKKQSWQLGTFLSQGVLL
jgi:hypothetical protein